MHEYLRCDNGTKPHQFPKLAESAESLITAQGEEISQLKSDVISGQRSVIAVVETLNKRADAQQVEIDQLTDAVATNEKTSAECCDQLKQQVKNQQVEIDNLSSSVASHDQCLDQLASHSAAADQQSQDYTAYLKAAAADLGSQYQKEREAHARTQRHLSDLKPNQP